MIRGKKVSYFHMKEVLRSTWPQWFLITHTQMKKRTVRDSAVLSYSRGLSRRLARFWWQRYDFTSTLMTRKQSQVYATCPQQIPGLGIKGSKRLLPAEVPLLLRKVDLQRSELRWKELPAGEAGAEGGAESAQLRTAALGRRASGTGAPSVWRFSPPPSAKWSRGPTFLRGPLPPARPAVAMRKCCSWSHAVLRRKHCIPRPRGPGGSYWPHVALVLEVWLMQWGQRFFKFCFTLINFKLKPILDSIIRKLWSILEPLGYTNLPLQLSVLWNLNTDPKFLMRLNIYLEIYCECKGLSTKHVRSHW